MDYDYETDSDYSGSVVSAQEHWEESVRQITGLINMVIFPLIGKILGRRFSKVIWARFANWYYS